MGDFIFGSGQFMVTEMNELEGRGGEEWFGKIKQPNKKP